MQTKTIDRLIPVVMEVMESYKQTFKKETSGYFSAFGPSVMMAGLYQTIKAYEGNKDKNRINEIILAVYRQMGWSQAEGSFDDLVREYDPLVKRRILDIVVACKLVIATYDLKDK